MTTALDIAQADPLALYTEDDILRALNEDEGDILRELKRRELVEQYKGVAWAEWLFEYLPDYFYSSFADHHVEFWEAVEQVPPSGMGYLAPAPTFAVFARGHGKSTNLEAACVRLGALKKRRFILYVSGTQDQADAHLATIAQMLRSPRIAKEYPGLANPRIEKTTDGTKQSRQLAWRASMLYTASGFAIMSLGLNTASRGIKIGSQRPDAQVYDDIDAKDDTVATVQKKIGTITQTIIPTRSPDAWVFGGQNLIHKNSVFSKMVENHPDAEFLLKRRMIGPVPALEDMKIGKDEEGRGIITGGNPTWPGMDLAACQAEVEDTGLRAFRIECQHETALDEGLFLSDVWSEPTHVLPLAGFVPPAGWRIDRSFDWGFARPYSCGWWAESDGNACTIAGQQRTFPRGTLILLAELYGWNGKPDTGLRHSDAQIALAIRQAQAQYPWANRVQAGPADNQIFDNIDNNTGESIHDRMVSATGQRWTRSHKGPGSRIAGATGIVARLRNSLVEPMERPGLFIASGCRHVIRTFPALPSSPTIDGDIDTDSEDHGFDMTRYRVHTRPVKTTVTRVKYK